MFRIALTALGIYLLWTLLRWAFRGGRARARQAGDGRAIEAAEMIACAGCGTFIVRADAVERGGKRFCSESCAASKH